MSAEPNTQLIMIDRWEVLELELAVDTETLVEQTVT